MKLENVILAMSEIENNRNIPKEIIIEALEDSLAKAYRKQIGVPDALVDVEVDDASGEMKVFHKFLVVEEVEDDELEVELGEINEEHPDLKLGDYLRKEIPIAELGRAAATLAKNVIKQKIREAEKQAVYDEYIDQMGEMILAMIESVEEKFVVMNLGKSLAIMPKTAQIPGEYYREGQTLRVIITNVNKDTKGAQILVSRADATIVRRLFENEVPEIFEGQVEIKAIAREAGDRTKIAVYSNDPDIDPIGACIGPRGTRVQNIIEELKGEKIDIFEWSSNYVELIKNALAPAEVVAVFASEGKGLTVVVPDDQLSLAIGKKGKNARLAVKLVKQRIDIKSETAAKEEGLDYMELMAQYEQEIAMLAETEETTPEVVVDVEEVTEETPVVEETVEAVVVDDAIEEAEEVETIVTEEVTPPEEIKETAVEETVETDENININKKDVYKPRTDYVSKFEELADVAKGQQNERARRKRYEEEKEKPVNTSELLKEKEYEIIPEYSDEELEEIKKQQEKEENSWYEDDIDFDEFDDFYDQE